ncbi:hypothetical protein OG520_42450 (plasmid) [Streptomyces sp. NBC_00984]|uniref:hypothetical protein n=1 Tax=Streptomyces sp. NBC_00984 TaxID=2903700 RepID=UPI0038671BBD|nr:hypothetical protein OG520_42450 [Streptomyces sp. NBC_00984]
MLRAALNSVAADEPEWLAGWVPSDWFDRYAIRFEDTRLPKGKTKQIEQNSCSMAFTPMTTVGVRQAGRR